MINVEEIRLTEAEATSAAYGQGRRLGINAVATSKRRLVADAQLSKTLWTIVDQLRTSGTLAPPPSDDFSAAAILEQIAIVIAAPHPTATNWFDPDATARTDIQAADPMLGPGLESDGLCL